MEQVKEMCETKELLTYDGVAKRLNVKKSTIEKWANQGWLPALRITPKTIRFDFDDVMSAIRQRRHPAGMMEGATA